VIFQRVDPSHEYSALHLQSQEGVWELGITPYHNGTRLRMGRAGLPPSVIDLCMGHDTRIYYPLLAAVLKLLKPISESTSAQEIDALFPWAGTRPDLNIHLGPLLSSLDKMTGHQDSVRSGISASGEMLAPRNEELRWLADAG
jgi:hypothetical protein